MMVEPWCWLDLLAAASVFFPRHLPVPGHATYLHTVMPLLMLAAHALAHWTSLLPFSRWRIQSSRPSLDVTSSESTPPHDYQPWLPLQRKLEKLIIDEFMILFLIRSPMAFCSELHKRALLFYIWCEWYDLFPYESVNSLILIANILSNEHAVLSQDWAKHFICGNLQPTHWPVGR